MGQLGGGCREEAGQEYPDYRDTIDGLRQASALSASRQRTRELETTIAAKRHVKLLERGQHRPC